jgi:hypothetical protein
MTVLKDVFNNIKGPIEMNLTHLEGELKMMICKLGGGVREVTFFQ